MNFLCRIGIHKYRGSTRFYPSIDAEIVTDVIFMAQCQRCSKLLSHEHLQWNGSDMVKVTGS